MTENNNKKKKIKAFPFFHFSIRQTTKINSMLLSWKQVGGKNNNYFCNCSIDETTTHQKMQNKTYQCPSPAQLSRGKQLKITGTGNAGFESSFRLQAGCT